MEKYLSSSEVIDWEHSEVIKKAKALSCGVDDSEVIAKACFEFVRDEIKHSYDFKLNPVTCKASDVLKYKTGYCYAKSHLLAALLRANGIPAGLCYQRLTLENNQPPFCLHGLNVVHLPKIGWYRLDPRGNKAGVEARFTPPTESLAFSTLIEGEIDFPEIYSEPLPDVVSVLNQSRTYNDVARNLPDIRIKKR